MNRPCKSHEFTTIKERLMRMCPPPKGTVVRVYRRSNMPDAKGDIEKVRNIFTIRICMSLSQREAEETLIHEWAHMMDWHAHHPLSGDHGATWGVWYARVYSAYHQER
jgi:hypothetical protein